MIKDMVKAGLKIETGIPVAPRETKKDRSEIRKFLSSLKIGDSFLLEGIDPVTASGNFSRYSRELNIKLACRAVEENGHKGTRVWRTD